MDHSGRHSLYNGGYHPIPAASYHYYYSTVDMGEDSRRYPDDSGSAGSTHWPSHHHHRLPDIGRSLSSMHGERDEGFPSMVGQEGMPSPARRPQRPRIKFTPEEDQLLIELKEQKHLTWRQIADFFPGRNPGTLQVRYCTKLKVEATPWTREMDERLLHALQSYEDEKWRIVAQKVGGGVTPMGCCDRVWELFNGDLDDASSFSFANES